MMGEPLPLRRRGEGPRAAGPRCRLGCNGEVPPRPWQAGPPVAVDLGFHDGEVLPHRIRPSPSPTTAPWH
ncbi:hypothetical protein NL676_021767 [Syzygium grande]|nr:hypothetical protein NL676_021767 [Syzygium grande]